MGTIQEITDDAKQKLDLSENTTKTSSSPSSSVPHPPQSPGSQHDGSSAPRPAEATTGGGGAASSRPVAGPERPPGLAAGAGKTTEEILADLNRSPLFMTDLDLAGGAEGNDDVAALQALAYEGTPLENADDFRERGNESFRARAWADAREFYDKGVAILVAEERRRARGEKKKVKKGEGEEEVEVEEDDSESEVREERAVLEALHVNRAACHLELKNLRSCTLDCAAALRLNPGNVKAYYRSAKALLALGKMAEADDACARGLAVEPGNAALRATAAEVATRTAALDARQCRENERLAREKRRALLLRAALRARGIRTRATAQPPDMDDVQLQLVPDPDSPESELSFPAVLLYPAHLQSDFVKAFHETHALADHLDYIFPLPWDDAREYTPAAVECYMETAAGGLIKVGKKMPLLQILSSGKVEVVDDLVKFFVVPKAKAPAWVQEFKSKKAAEKGQA